MYIQHINIQKQACNYKKYNDYKCIKKRSTEN